MTYTLGKATFNFDGKTVVIVGASKGIGLATASAFLESGANVINISRSLGKDNESNSCWKSD